MVGFENLLYFQLIECALLTEMSANPLDNDGIEPGAFEGVTIYHIRIAEAKLTSIPKGIKFLAF